MLRSRVALLPQAFGGLLVGVLLVIVSHRLSQSISRWAVVQGFADLDGGWLVARFVAWAVPGVAAAFVLWGLFGNKAILPAAVAALAVPLLYFTTFIAFFGIGNGLRLATPYLFETLVVLLALPGTVFLVTRSARL